MNESGPEAAAPTPLTGAPRGLRVDPKGDSWFEDVGLPVHNHSVAEYEDMLRRAGWAGIDAEVFEFRTDPLAKRDAHDRPLLITARKPC